MSVSKDALRCILLLAATASLGTAYHLPGAGPAGLRRDGVGDCRRAGACFSSRSQVLYGDMLQVLPLPAGPPPIFFARECRDVPYGTLHGQVAVFAAREPPLSLRAQAG